ncbi:capsid protein [Calfel virus LSF31_cyc420]|uniref:Capsid protein n=1 Tax=Calfel virus LSF31_cyc420 TaxID=2951259 RepID=A0AAX3BPM6_9CIRC|nr:capsid protein [Calfel virus LSF31_cyc420]UUG66204.1 capsid protein [Calfel virus LSF31_cyc420]
MRVKTRPVRRYARAKRVRFFRTRRPYRTLSLFRRPLRRNRSGYFIAKSAIEEEYTPCVTDYSKYITVSLSKFPEFMSMKQQFSHFKFLFASVRITPLSGNNTDHPCGTYLLVPFHGDLPGMPLNKMDRAKILQLDMVKEYRCTSSAYRRFVPAIIENINVSGQKDPVKRLLYRPTLECRHNESPGIEHNAAILCFPPNTHDMRYNIKIECKVLFTGQVFP